jgi:hypothetical protein
MNGIEIKDVKFVQVNKWGFSFDSNLGENELPMIIRSEITPKINKEHVNLQFYAMGKESHNGLEHDMNIEIHMTYKEFEELALKVIGLSTNLMNPDHEIFNKDFSTIFLKDNIDKSMLELFVRLDKEKEKARKSSSQSDCH